MSQVPSAEEMAFEIDVAKGLKSLYGTNQPGKTYEDGVVETLQWVMGGPKPNGVQMPQIMIEKGRRCGMGVLQTAILELLGRKP